MQRKAKAQNREEGGGVGWAGHGQHVALADVPLASGGWGVCMLIPSQSNMEGSFVAAYHAHIRMYVCLRGCLPREKLIIKALQGRTSGATSDHISMLMNRFTLPRMGYHKLSTGLNHYFK